MRISVGSKSSPHTTHPIHTQTDTHTPALPRRAQVIRESVNATLVTATGALRAALGTPLYMSPEQIEEEREPDGLVA